MTTGELELGYKNLKSPEVVLDENDKTYGLNNKDWKDDWGKAIQPSKKAGYNIINH